MSPKKMRNRAKVIDAKWDAKMNAGKEIQLINGGFATVDEDNFEYFNQWKWFGIEAVGAARFEYNADAELNLVLLANEVMGVQSYYVEFDGLDDELKPFAKIEDANVFDPEKYEKGREFGFDRPMRSFTDLEDRELLWNPQILRIVAHRRGKHVIAACPLPEGDHQIDADKYDDLFDSWSRLVCQKGFICTAIKEALRRSAEQSDSGKADCEVARGLRDNDALIVLAYPDKIAEKSSWFKIAISQKLPLFDVSADPIRIWNNVSGHWDYFCEKLHTYSAVHQYLTEFRSARNGDQEEYIAEPTEAKVF